MEFTRRFAGVVVHFAGACRKRSQAIAPHRAIPIRLTKLKSKACIREIAKPAKKALELSFGLLDDLDFMALF